MLYNNRGNMLVKLEDTNYSSAEEKAKFIYEEIEDTIKECLEVINYSEKVKLESLVLFCNTGKFFGE